MQANVVLSKYLRQERYVYPAFVGLFVCLLAVQLRMYLNELILINKFYMFRYAKLNMHSKTDEEQPANLEPLFRTTKRKFITQSMN